MTLDLSGRRVSYESRPLHRSNLASDPLEQFARWFEEAQEQGICEPNAMVLSTVSETGGVSSRTVLLKAFDERGFVFFTNLESRKAREITGQPQVSLLFPWLPLARQVEIGGEANKVTLAESTAYFLKRPAGSRLSAWVSAQSQIICSRRLLIDQFVRMKKQFENGQIPVPPAWGGFRIRPQFYEFWQGGPDRLHDRFRYRREGSAWTIDRLAP